MDPQTLAKIRATRDALTQILLELDAVPRPPAPAPQPAFTPPPSYAPPQALDGLLQNPYVGRVENITWREIPTKNGPQKLFELHVGGVRMGTFKADMATLALQASEAGQPVSITWKSRVNENAASGRKYTNYDVVTVSVPRSVVN